MRYPKADIPFIGMESAPDRENTGISRTVRQSLRLSQNRTEACKKRYLLHSQDSIPSYAKIWFVGQSEKRNAGYGEYLHKHPNLLNRDFKTEKINQEWVTGSYTCTPSEEGVLVGHQRSVSELRKM